MLRRQLFGCGDQLYPLSGTEPEPGTDPLSTPTDLVESGESQEQSGTCVFKVNRKLDILISDAS